MTFNLGGATQSAQQAFESNLRSLTDNAIKLATAQRINRGADDPAGLISSEALRAELAVLEAETRAASRADAVANVADAALGEAAELLVDASAAEVQLADGFLSEAERKAIAFQRDSSIQASERVLSMASFGGTRLFSGDVTLNAGGGELSLAEMDLNSLGSFQSGGESYTLADVPSGRASEGSGIASSVIRAAREQVSSLRGELGAFQRNVIEPTIRATEQAFEQIASAESMIRDADYAKTASAAARDEALIQSSASVLAVAQSNQATVLSLLGGG
ncbi:MAG: flagellin [Planctomycetota bacterium]